MCTIKLSLKTRAACFIALFCLFSGVARSQEQFEKRFDISFTKTPLKNVVAALTKTQSEMTFSYGNDSSWMVPITLDLKNVTLDEVIDKVLAQQTHFKDYVVTHYGSFTELEMLEEKGGARFFDREKNKGKYYHIGERLPDSVYTISNFTDKTVRLSGLKKKLIILDMWNIHCKGCIQDMPRMQKLQEEFKDQVQVILVTKDSKLQVEALKKWVRNVRETKLPSITGENVLGSLFQYFYVPKQVWIDESGVVRYITNKEIATEKYIKGFLAGDRMAIGEAKDTVIGSEYDTPLVTALQPVNGGDFYLSAYLAPHQENKYNFNMYAGGSDEKDTLKSERYERIDFYTLYKIAYQIHDPYTFSNARFIRNFTNPEKYDPDYFSGTNIYDYELLTKRQDISKRKFYRLMQGQLDAFFTVNSSIQKRKVPCYILRSTDKGSRLKTKGGTPDYEHEENIISVVNVAWNYIMGPVNGYRVDKLPLVDETGIDPAMKVDWRIDIGFEDNLPAIQKSLAAYGLTLTKGEREMDCIIMDVD